MRAQSHAQYNPISLSTRFRLALDPRTDFAHGTVVCDRKITDSVVPAFAAQVSVIFQPTQVVLDY